MTRSCVLRTWAGRLRFSVVVVETDNAPADRAASSDAKVESAATEVASSIP